MNQLVQNHIQSQDETCPAYKLLSNYMERENLQRRTSSILGRYYTGDLQEFVHRTAIYLCMKISLCTSRALELIIAHNLPRGNYPHLLLYSAREEVLSCSSILGPSRAVQQKLIIS